MTMCMRESEDGADVEPHSIEAFRWLERGFLERAAFMDGVKVTPAFDALHGDPRWGSLLRRMGLEQTAPAESQDRTH
jgi:hypothetical protein